MGKSNGVFFFISSSEFNMIFLERNLTDTHHCFLLHNHQLQKRGSVHWRQKNVCHSYFDIVEMYGLRHRKCDVWG